MIVVLPLPKTAAAVKERVHLFRRKRFPGMDNLRQRMPGKHPSHNVHMVGHDAPGEEPVALVVEASQSICHDVGYRGMLEMARARTAIEVLLDHSGGKLFDLGSLTRAQLSFELLGSLDHALPFGLYPFEDGFRKGIAQPECHEIGGAFLFPVWQAAAIANFYFPEAGAGRPRDSRRDAGATVELIV